MGKEKETGIEQSVTIQGASNLNENEVETMLEDAEKFAAIDKEKRETINLKNQAETLCSLGRRAKETGICGTLAHAGEHKGIYTGQGSGAGLLRSHATRHLPLANSHDISETVCRAFAR